MSQVPSSFSFFSPLRNSGAGIGSPVSPVTQTNVKRVRLSDSISSASGDTLNVLTPACGGAGDSLRQNESLINPASIRMPKMLEDLKLARTVSELLGRNASMAKEYEELLIIYEKLRDAHDKSLKEIGVLKKQFSVVDTHVDCEGPSVVACACQTDDENNNAVPGELEAMTLERDELLEELKVTKLTLLKKTDDENNLLDINKQLKVRLNNLVKQSLARSQSMRAYPFRPTKEVRIADERTKGDSLKSSFSAPDVESEHQKLSKLVRQLVVMKVSYGQLTPSEGFDVLIREEAVGEMTMADLVMVAPKKKKSSLMKSFRRIFTPKTKDCSVDTVKIRI